MHPFVALCRDVGAATRHRLTVEECAPEYQRVLDYIQIHPEEHSAIVQAFRDSVIGTSGPSPASIYLVRFCMRALKWPEIKAAAVIAFNDGGNALRAQEIAQLLAIYA
jgi:hypothetical protein